MVLISLALTLVSVLLVFVPLFTTRILLAYTISTTMLIAQIAAVIVLLIIILLIVGSPERKRTWLSIPLDHITIIRAIGPVAFISFLLSSLVIVGSNIVVIGRRCRLPLFAVTIAVIFVVSSRLSTDSHPVRRPFASTEEPIGLSFSFPKDTELADRLSRWEEVKKNSGAERYDDPIFIVSAEGGGIRAAYFTAITLARIADECPQAANRIFAVSAVSGGSIGAAIYAAAVHQHPLVENVRRCNFSTNSEPGPIGLAIEAIFEKDHLTPLLARMLLSDLSLNILPFYIPQFDRQLGLEFSLENSFEEQFHSATLSTPFDELTPSQEHHSTPYLMTNMTSLEGGLHFVSSSILWGTEDDESSMYENSTPDAIHFVDSFWSPYITDRFSVISIAGASARFPFISPPGFVDNTKIGRRHFVDGGYYDNTGLLTALSLFRSLKRLSAGPVVIIHIGNQPECNQEEQPSSEQSKICKSAFYSKQNSTGFDALFGPASVLIGVRTEQAYVLRGELERTIEASNETRNSNNLSPPNSAIGIQITQDIGPEPLGWFLSNPALGKLRQAAFRTVEGLRCTRGSKGPSRLGAIQGIGYAATLRADAPDIDRAFLGIRSGSEVPFANQCGFMLLQEFLTRTALLDDPFKHGFLPDSGMPGGQAACVYQAAESWLQYAHPSLGAKCS
jgi:predicted acylesterase/phospholipase RssA